MFVTVSCKSGFFFRNVSCIIVYHIKPLSQLWNYCKCVAVRIQFQQRKEGRTGIFKPINTLQWNGLHLVTSSFYIINNKTH